MKSPRKSDSCGQLLGNGHCPYCHFGFLFRPETLCLSAFKNGRAGEIRTRDLLNPIQAHYQAVLRPDTANGRFEKRKFGRGASKGTLPQGSSVLVGSLWGASCRSISEGVARSGIAFRQTPRTTHREADPSRVPPRNAERHPQPPEAPNAERTRTWRHCVTQSVTPRRRRRSLQEGPGCGLNLAGQNQFQNADRRLPLICAVVQCVCLLRVTPGKNKTTLLNMRPLLTSSS